MFSEGNHWVERRIVKCSKYTTESEKRDKIQAFECDKEYKITARMVLYIYILEPIHILSCYDYM